MARRASPFSRDWSVADLLDHFDIPAHRIRLHPPPGRATERDVARLHDREKRLFELIDGVLVEKTMGVPESLQASLLVHLLWDFVLERRLGGVVGADGTLRLLPGQVRIPDACFVRREKLPGGTVPAEPVPDLVPDLAVEVLSTGNTRTEMDRKLKDYFFAGTRLVWYIDLPSRSVQVFTAPDQSVTLREGQTLDGGAVLPGFAVPLKELSAFLSGPSRKGKRRKPGGAA